MLDGVTALPGSFKPYRGLPDYDDRDPFAARARHPWRVAAVVSVLVLIASLGVEWTVLRSVAGRTPGAAVAVRHRTIPVVLGDMAHAMLRLARPDAAEEIAEELVALAA